MRKKLISILIVSILWIGFIFTSTAMASTYKTMYLNKKVEIVYDNQTQGFYDVSGKTVYPISYEGTTYLPIRAITSMFGTTISWDSINNTVYMSTMPNDGSNLSALPIEDFIPEEMVMISALVNDEIIIRFNDDVQEFKDVNGKIVYPISYQGTTYLPVRAISALYNANIEWDGEKNQIQIEKANILEFSGDKITIVDGIDTSNSKNFDYTATYINNENRFAEIKLEKKNNGKVLFQFKNVSLNGSPAMARYELDFKDGVAYCKQLDATIYLANHEIVIKTDLESSSVLNGTYRKEGKEHRTIEFSDLEENKWNGYFNKTETIQMTLSDWFSDFVVMTLAKYGEDKEKPNNVVMMMLQKTKEDEAYIAIGNFGELQRYRITYIEKDMIKVEIDTGDVVTDKLFNGVYIKSEISPRELYLRLKPTLDGTTMGDGVTGHMM